MIYITLTKEEEKKLKTMMRQEIGRVSMRAHMILLNAMLMMSAPEIAKLYDTHPDSVRVWLKRYKELGCEGLYDEAKGGRPKSLSKAEERELKKIVEYTNPPQDSCAVIWTVSLLLVWLKNTYNKTVSSSTLRRVLHNLEFAWKRPCLWPTFNDPFGSSKMADIISAFNNLAEGDIMLCLDETRFRLLPLIRACWQKICEQKKINIGYSWNSSFNLFGAIDIFTGKFIRKITSRSKSEDFIGFLKLILENYPQGNIFIILDKASWHTSKLVKTFLEDNPRIHFLWLPTGTPQLNPVEKVWQKLKSYTASDRWFGSIKNLKEQVDFFFEHKLDSELLTLAGLNV